MRPWYGWSFLLGWILLAPCACSSNEVIDAGAAPVAPPGGVALHGAGATFPDPLYQKWIELYSASNPDILIQYDAVGSGKGTTEFLAGMVDFGASDAALTDEQMSGVKRGAMLVPMTAGSIVIAYNPTDLPPNLKLPRDVYADIFLGKITHWNDSRIRAANPQAKFPDRTIQVVARADSSGTTYAFTNHLAAINPAWREGPGVGKVVQWPGSAIRAHGNERVAAAIMRDADTIGYVEYGMAQRTGLSLAVLENKAGKFISPTGQAGMATLRNAELPDNLRAFFPDPPGEDSYPIVTYTWLLLYDEYKDARQLAELKRFVDWCLTQGQQYNESLGYVQLPPEVARRAQAAVDAVGQSDAEMNSQPAP